MWGAGCIMAEMWTRSPIMQVFQYLIYKHHGICLLTELMAHKGQYRATSVDIDLPIVRLHRS